MLPQLVFALRRLGRVTLRNLVGDNTRMGERKGQRRSSYIYWPGVYDHVPKSDLESLPQSP
jgi:hypothetical protein